MNKDLTHLSAFGFSFMQKTFGTLFSDDSAIKFFVFFGVFVQKIQGRFPGIQFQHKTFNGVSCLKFNFETAFIIEYGPVKAKSNLVTQALKDLKKILLDV